MTTGLYSLTRIIHTLFHPLSRPRIPVAHFHTSVYMSEAFAKSPSVLVTCNGVETDCKLQPRDFLRSMPSGPYTAMRTVDKKAIFKFEFHVDRMVTSCSSLLKLSPPPATMNTDSLMTIEGFRKLAIDDIRTSLHVFHQRFPEAAATKQDLKVILLVNWRHREEDSDHILATNYELPTLLSEDKSGRDFRLYTHTSLLFQSPRYPVQAQVAFAHRENAVVKDSEWIKTSEALEGKAPPGTNEVVMAARVPGLDQIPVLEGLSSNFYAILGGVVYTANEGILLGSMRKLVIEICTDNNIPIKLEPPNLRDFAKWEGALISSTSRFLLPIHKLIFPEHAEFPAEHRFQYEEESLVMRLDRLVRARVAQDSELVTEE